MQQTREGGGAHAPFSSLHTAGLTNCHSRKTNSIYICADSNKSVYALEVIRANAFTQNGAPRHTAEADPLRREQLQTQATTINLLSPVFPSLGQCDERERGVNNSTEHYAVIFYLPESASHNNIYCLTFRELQNNRNVGTSD